MRMHWISGVGKCGQLREPEIHRTMALGGQPCLRQLESAVHFARFTSARDSLNNVGCTRSSEHSASGPVNEKACRDL
jgi:hypothetical protein